MKYILPFLFALPLLAFAGGHEVSQCTPPTQIVMHVIEKPTEPTITPTPPPVIPNLPVVTTSVSNGTNGQIWCSGPTAPGWDRNYPDGNCNKKQCVPITNFKVGNKVKGDGKIEVYWTNPNYVNIWKKEKGVISHYWVKGSYFEVPTQGGWFWLSNECYTTEKIDP